MKNISLFFLPLLATALIAFSCEGDTDTPEEVSYECRSLQIVAFAQGSNLVSIEERAFVSCKELTTFDAAACTKLESIELFAFYSTNLSLFKIGAKIPPVLEYGLDYNPFIYGDNGNLKVPDASVELYKASEWSEYFPNISGLNE